ncbi:GTP-binding protein HSR1-related [Anaeromyxobacter sp. K]|uniref:GTPase n=1 Tax=Anaeromyxobacter sp. (strain K) TaxID=447217 RepID=UPI00015F864B|nr:GTPase [Anaeromyxobacter sp. K]ACG72991.1 GTP-binding protein HSR1-related [Anaeromyxobacter sp. K]
MPANVPPRYKDAELRLHRATTREEKEDALREMIALLPHHKGTDKLLGDLRARLSKLEEEATHAHRPGRRAEVGQVVREGAGQWVMIGPANSGKSSLLAALTHARPEIAEYPFTTRDPLPGMMEFEDVQVQLVDTPAVGEAQVPAWLPQLVHGADGVLIVLDVAADDLEAGLTATLELLERARVRPAGRAAAPGASPLERTVPVVVLANRCDLDDDGTFAALAREAVPPDLFMFSVSATRGDGLDGLRAVLFRSLHRIRVHTKEPGHAADAGKPFVLPEGATVHDLADRVHHDLAERLKFARLWGPHARFEGQQVDRGHVLGDGDVVELHS